MAGSVSGYWLGILYILVVAVIWTGGASLEQGRQRIGVHTSNTIVESQRVCVWGHLIKSAQCILALVIAQKMWIGVDRSDGGQTVWLKRAFVITCIMWSEKGPYWRAYTDNTA